MITNKNLAHDAKLRYSNMLTLNAEVTTGTVLFWSELQRFEIVALQLRTSTVITGTTVIQIGTASDADAYGTKSVPDASAAATLLLLNAGDLTTRIIEKDTPVLLSTDGAGTGSVQAILVLAPLDEDPTKQTLGLPVGS